MSRRPVALVTDFGSKDPYVGVMKAVILGINPDAQIIDLTHEVEPQAVEQGAFLLATALPYLPFGTVCAAVVDPGVGTGRVPIALRTPSCFFVGPDNGILSAALPDSDRPAGPAQETAAEAPIPSGYAAYRLDNPRYSLAAVSDTFHGRDLFAPAAAHLSNGVPISELGTPVDRMRTFPPWRAAASAAGELRGKVLYTDRFGNLVTDVRGSDLPTDRIQVEIGGLQLSGLQHSYQDSGEFVVYVGSAGYLEIGRRNGNASAALAMGPGDSVLVSQNP